uniref:Uncharacterized protein n=1 Tax=Anguilla anguilla TaxID=7936 RepID=A0A0E9XCU7_ANGAN
MEFCSQVHHVL